LEDNCNDTVRGNCFSVRFHHYSTFASNVIKTTFYLVLTHLFVNTPRPGDSEGTFAISSQAATCTTSLTTKGRGSSVKCLAQGHKRTCQLIFTVSRLMLNVKQGSCENNFFKSFGSTRRGKRTEVYQLRGGRSNH